MNRTEIVAAIKTLRMALDDSVESTAIRLYVSQIDRVLTYGVGDEDRHIEDYLYGGMSIERS